MLKIPNQFQQDNIDIFIRLNWQRFLLYLAFLLPSSSFATSCGMAHSFKKPQSQKILKHLPLDSHAKKNRKQGKKIKTKIGP